MAAAPLARLWHSFARAVLGLQPIDAAPTPRCDRPAVHPRTARPNVLAKPITPMRSARPNHPSRTPPLRVVHMRDHQHAPYSQGRMVISGRMADVCAELERLAAREVSHERSTCQVH